MTTTNDNGTRAGVPLVQQTTQGAALNYARQDRTPAGQMQGPPIGTADIDALGLTSTGQNFDNNVSNVLHVLTLLAARGVFGVRIEVIDGPGHHAVGPSLRFSAPRYFYGSERGSQGPDQTRLAVLIQRLDPRFRKVTPNVAFAAACEFMRQFQQGRT